MELRKILNQSLAYPEPNFSQSSVTPISKHFQSSDEQMGFFLNVVRVDHVSSQSRYLAFLLFLVNDHSFQLLLASLSGIIFSFTIFILKDLSLIIP